MNNFLIKYNLAKLIPLNIRSLSRPITIEKKLPKTFLPPNNACVHMRMHTFPSSSSHRPTRWIEFPKLPKFPKGILSNHQRPETRAERKNTNF